MAVRPLLAVLALLLVPLARAQTNPSRGDVRLVVLSDFNGAYGSTSYSRAVASAITYTTSVWKPDLFVSAGDVVAGQNAALPESRFAEMWSAFDGAVAAPLRHAGIPYAFATGNHDGSSLRAENGTYAFARERSAANAYWGRPMYLNNLDYLDRTNFPFRYSFVFQGVFFLFLDASSARLGPAQESWMEAQLQSPAARRAELRIVVGHLPLAAASPDKNRPGEVLAGADRLLASFQRGRVDLYISGHHAAYYLGRKGGIELLFSGGIGARPLLGSSAAPRSTVSVVDLDLAPARIRITTFDAFTGEEVALASLPESLAGLGGPVRRADLVPLSPLARGKP